MTERALVLAGGVVAGIAWLLGLVRRRGTLARLDRDPERAESDPRAKACRRARALGDVRTLVVKVDAESAATIGPNPLDPSRVRGTVLGLRATQVQRVQPHPVTTQGRRNV